MLPALLLIQTFSKSSCNCTSLVPLLVPIRNCFMSVPSEPFVFLWSAFQDLWVFPASLYTHFCTKDLHDLFLLNIIDPRAQRFCLMSTNAATCISEFAIYYLIISTFRSSSLSSWLQLMCKCCVRAVCLICVCLPWPSSSQGKLPFFPSRRG